jgi:hypothetical protein
LQLTDNHPIFIGFKLDGSLRHQLESLSGPDKKYVSRDEATFLMLCNHGKDTWVGKVVDDRLSTDRVDDIRRNILSILQRLCPESRLPTHMQIWPCRMTDDGYLSQVDKQEKSPPERAF